MRPEDAPGGEHVEARTPPEPITRLASLGSALSHFARSQHPAVRAALVVIVLPVALLVAFGFDRALASGCVQRGVWVGPLAASGLDRPTGEREIERLAKRLSVRRATVQIGRRLFSLDANAVGFSVDTPGTVAAAFDVGRQGGAYSQLASWLQRWTEPTRVAARATLDEAAFQRMLARFETEALPDAPFDGAVRVVGTTVSPEYPRSGRRLDRRALRQLVLERLLGERGDIAVVPTVPGEPRLDRAAVDDAVRRARALLSGPVELVDDVDGETLHIEAATLAAALRSRPAEGVQAGLSLAFDATALEPALGPARARLERAPQDARFVTDVRDHVSVSISQSGTRLDANLVANAALEAALGPSRKAPLPLLRDLPPRFTTEQAQALGIRERVGQFTTRHACCQPRVQNIHRIAELLNDVIVRPGETLSVNTLVGPRTQKNGFVLAPGIEEGEMVDSVGGGVSQFATTLFNAVFHAGYDIIERQAHSFWFPRYPMGHEATLSYPKPDLVFRNDTNAGLVIKTDYTDTRITVRLYGDNGGRKVTAEVSSQREITQPPTELIANPKLWPEESDRKESGVVGWSVIVSRLIRYPDGSEKRETRKVTYKPRPRRVEVHPCKIPKGQPGHTGDPCPVPDPSADEDGASPADIPEVN